MLRALLFILALAPEIALAQPKSWIPESDDVEEREGKLFRFSPRLNFWYATFDRPPRACKGAVTPRGGPAEPRLLRAQQLFPDVFCPSEDSSEIAFGSGVEIAFRALYFIYLTAGIDFLYTAPEFSTIKNQLVLAL